MLWMDLRAEPIVISVPAVDPKRYYSVQLIDSSTYNYGYIGSRATGSDAGDYLVVGPDWRGETPAGIKKVFKSSSQHSLAIFRTQLFNAADIDNVDQGAGRLQGAPALGLPQSARPAGGAGDRLPQDRRRPREEELLPVRRLHDAVHAADAERGRDPRRPRQDRRRGRQAVQPRQPQARRPAADPDRHEDGGPADRRRGQPLRQDRQRLADRSCGRRRGVLQRRLAEARRGRQGRHLRQRSDRGRLSLRPHRRSRPPARRQAQVHADLPGRRPAARSTPSGR